MHSILVVIGVAAVLESDTIRIFRKKHDLCCKWLNSPTRKRNRGCWSTAPNIRQPAKLEVRSLYHLYKASKDFCKSARYHYITHLDYGNLIYYPTTKKCKQILENAQRRATRLVPELHGMSYRERLMEFNLSTLEYRRKRYDIIQVFKIIHKIDDIDMSKFFTFTDNSQLRGHNLKLNKPRVNKSIRLNSFAMRTIPVWNNLPSEIVNSKTVLEFKTKLDKLWENSRYDLSEIY